MLNYFEKTFTHVDDTGNTKGIPRKLTIREIFAIQMKVSVRKLCKLFVVYVMDDKDNENKLKIEYMPILKEFEDFFGLPSKRDIDFTINLIPGAVPASKAPY